MLDLKELRQKEQERQEINARKSLSDFINLEATVISAALGFDVRGECKKAYEEWQAYKPYARVEIAAMNKALADFLVNGKRDNGIGRLMAKADFVYVFDIRDNGECRVETISKLSRYTAGGIPYDILEIVEKE